MFLDAGVLRIALAHKNPDIRESTIKLAVASLTDRRQTVDPKAKEALTQRFDVEASEPAHLSFPRELARRLIGEKAVTRDDWLLWIATSEGTNYLRRNARLGEVLSSEEMAAMPPEKERSGDEVPAPPKMRPLPVEAAPFFIPSVLPTGMAAAVLAVNGCRGQWVGVGEVTVDRQGRVQNLNLGEVQTSSRCRRALEAISRLSLAYNRSILSPMTTQNAVFIKPAGRDMCLDEGDVPLAQAADFEACLPYRISDDTMACKPPVVKKLIRPGFPLTARHKVGSDDHTAVLLEALVSETGCVREAHMVGQSPFAQLNAEALLALLQWQFEPAEANGIPIPVLFELAVHFVLR